MDQDNRNQLAKQTTSLTPSTRSLTRRTSEIIERHLSGVEKQDSVRTVAQRSDDEFRLYCLQALKVVAIYYPDFADGCLNNKAWVDEFMESMNDMHPNLLAVELQPLFKKQMRSYRYHTAPKMNDLFKMVSEYQESRLDALERFKWNEKQEQLEPVSDEVIKVMKDAQDEAAREMEEERERLRELK